MIKYLQIHCKVRDLPCELSFPTNLKWLYQDTKCKNFVNLAKSKVRNKNLLAFFKREVFFCYKKKLIT